MACARIHTPTHTPSCNDKEGNPNGGRSVSLPDDQSRKCSEGTCWPGSPPSCQPLDDICSSVSCHLIEAINLIDQWLHFGLFASHIIWPDCFHSYLVHVAFQDRTTMDTGAPSGSAAPSNDGAGPSSTQVSPFER